jgi:radical SAM protein with 4Fe4S-binding SPASM domain
MLRVTEYIRNVLEEKRPKGFEGTILIWNLTNRCNLFCRHCYSSASALGDGELSLGEVKELVPQLGAAGVRFAILSGGEPLMREDLFDIAGALRENGIRTYLSTNGLLIDRENVQRIRDGFDYVGISIDGTPEVHDSFRGKRGACLESLNALRLCMEKGCKVGLRFSLAPMTRPSLSYIFDLIEREGIPKIYISHLVYSGRGSRLSDLEKKECRVAAGFVLGKAFEYVEGGRGIDVVTGNSDADAVLLLKEFEKRYKDRYKAMRETLKKWGGNQAGVRVVNIDYRGEVKPDPFFAHSLGSIKEKKLDEIWSSNGMLSMLRERPRRLKGRCGDCTFIEICNGGSRARAYSSFGDYLEEDPACFI